MNKKPWLSKTIWFNLLVALSAMIFPSVNDWLVNNPSLFASIWSALNIVLRFVTKDSIALEE